MASITLQGSKFNIPEPFEPGYTLRNVGEARALNQALAKNLRNNFVKRVRDTLNGSESLTPEQEQQLQQELEKYASEYEFGTRTGRTVTRDPVEKEMKRLMRDDYIAAFRAKHGAAPSREQSDEAVRLLTERSGAEYAKRARAALKERERRSAEVMEGLV